MMALLRPVILNRVLVLLTSRQLAKNAN